MVMALACTELRAVQRFCRPRVPGIGRVRCWCRRLCPGRINDSLAHALLPPGARGPLAGALAPRAAVPGSPPREGAGAEERGIFRE
ncbi:hypothetical protein Efla_005185 [Eimeria flavescens]